jgi:putative transcriptional regulator
MPIGNNISSLLEVRREKIRQFARNIDISYTAAFELYHARTTAVSFSLLNKLCEYFNLTPSEIFPYTPEKRNAERARSSE